MMKSLILCLLAPCWVAEASGEGDGDPSGLTDEEIAALNNAGVTFTFVLGFWDFETCTDDTCGQRPTRTVECHGSNGQKGYDLSMCPGDEPSTQGELCPPCPGPVLNPETGATYEWRMDAYDFTTCTNDQGAHLPHLCGETQRRPVTCRKTSDTVTDELSTDYLCDRYIQTAKSECSVADLDCPRNAVCALNDQGNGKCSKPSVYGELKCDGCIRYAFTPSEWDFEIADCTAETCGRTQTRTITCMGTDKQEYDNSKCPGAQQSTLGESCPVCPTYDYHVSSWLTSSSNVEVANPVDDCSKPSVCGELLERTITCQDYKFNNTVAASICEELKIVKPSLLYQCGQCGFSWKSSDWSPSSEDCVCFKSQTRTFQCKHNDGAVIEGDDQTKKKCGELPSATQECDKVGCVRDTYELGPWAPATCSCSYTEQVRTVDCVDQYGTINGFYDECTAGTARPASVRECAKCDYRWTKGLWSDCECGVYKTRSVECLVEDVVILERFEEDVCPMSSKPDSVHVCEVNSETLAPCEEGAGDGSGAISLSTMLPAFLPIFFLPFLN